MNKKIKRQNCFYTVPLKPLHICGPCKIDPAVGNKNALVLLVEFKDKSILINQLILKKSIFKGIKEEDYFWKYPAISDITGKVLNQYLLPGNRSVCG